MKKRLFVGLGMALMLVFVVQTIHVWAQNGNLKFYGLIGSYLVEVDPTNGEATEEVKHYFGLGDFEKIPVKVQTDKGPQESHLRGQILLKILKHERGVELHLMRLNLIANSVNCKKDKSGLISLSFIRESDEVSYSKDGSLQIDFRMNLHYPLITKIHGYRPQKEKEQDNFVPYVAYVKGILKGKFEPPLDTILEDFELKKEKLSIKLKLEASLNTDEHYMGKFEWKFDDVIKIAEAIEYKLKVQPVFIRSGPDDPSPTGKSFNTLIQSAKCMWRKCCVHLDVLEPVYVDNDAYKVIDNEQEARNLMNEVDIDDAVEIFVADRMATALYNGWGGGASFDSGTATAKIVSCDAQLEVPDPNDGFLGAINYNHLAHELGHSMSLLHPGGIAIPPMVVATPNTVMEPSGFYADNPHPQSQYNCDSADNPLFKYKFVLLSQRCIKNPEI